MKKYFSFLLVSVFIFTTGFPQTEKIIIINSFDAQSVNARKNKKELFTLLTDSLKQFLYKKVEPTYKEQAVIYPELPPLSENPDSSIISILIDSGASTAIVIKSLDAYFEKKDVEVTGNKKEGKSVKVFYDICAVVTYALYNTEEKLSESVISICEPYSERASLSGFITFGPDIVGKRKDAIKIIEKNVEKLFLTPGLPLFSKNSSRKITKIPAIDTTLKYLLSFADQAQLMYDGGPLKTRFNRSFMEWGDVSYYNGKYFNARMRYAYAFVELPYGETGLDSAFSDLVMLDTNIRNTNYIKVYTRAITSVGMLYETRGKFTQAELLLNKALQTREKWFGKNSREYLNSLFNLAVLKKDMGLYDEAETMFNYLQPVIKELFSVNSPQYITLLNNKSLLYAELGRTKEAIQMLDEALETGATVLNASYFDYERILTNRAILEQESGDLEKAEKYYLLAIANIEKKGFDDHPDYNNVMVYYGSLLVQKNDPGILNFLSKAAEKAKKRYGQNHPLTAKALGNSADYYLNKKMYTEAMDIYKEVESIQRKVLGERHKDYLNTLLKLAVCEWQLQDNENAALHFNQAIQSYLQIVQTFFRSMSEREKSDFWKTLKPNIDTYFAFVVATGQANPGLLKEAFNLQLKTKGILIYSTKQTKKNILNSVDSVTRNLYKEWLGLKTKLSAYYNSPLNDLKDDKINLTSLEQQINEIEKELSGRSSQFNMAYEQPDISFDDVRAKLTKDEVAIEIIRLFHYYGEKKGQTDYFGLIVTKDSSTPAFIHISHGIDFEKSYLSNYLAAIKNKVPDTISYGIYWGPIERVIGDHKTVYISVDGVYNNINLNTLRQNDGTYILDHYKIVLIPNTRTITGLQTKTVLPAGGPEALLMGFPDYGNDEIIHPLPETKEEIQQIDTLLFKDNVKTKVLIGQDASEENVKLSNHPAILHIATHGFFHSNVELDRSMNMRLQVSRAKDNALLRSGLLFNGAALALKNEPFLDASNNGILYAYEAVDMDLQGTNLVVLSACETGIGEIINGEGVYGLSRSFQVAGADKILMSLWKVDDKPTRELMVLFYNNWLRLNDMQQAFIEAQRSMKEKYHEPYYWGAFVLLN